MDCDIACVLVWIVTLPVYLCELRHCLYTCVDCDIACILVWIERLHLKTVLYLESFVFIQDKGEEMILVFFFTFFHSSINYTQECWLVLVSYSSERTHFLKCIFPQIAHQKDTLGGD